MRKVDDLVRALGADSCASDLARADRAGVERGNTRRDNLTKRAPPRVTAGSQPIGDWGTPMGTSGSVLVLWARHGQNQANLTRQFSHRRLDLDLTPRGREEAERLAAALAAGLGEANGPPALFSSPLRRALQTAEIVATRVGGDLAVVDDLRELNVGDLDGRADSEAWRIYESVLDHWRQGHYERSFPGGEDWYELCARLHSALCGVAAAAPGGVAIVIAHGANLRAALPGLAHVPDPGSDLGTGQFADLQVIPTGTAAQVRLLAWRPEPI